MRSSMLAGRDQDGRFRSKGGFASLISCDESDARLDLKRLAVCAPPLLAKRETQSLPESLLLTLQATSLFECYALLQKREGRDEAMIEESDNG